MEKIGLMQHYQGIETSIINLDGDPTYVIDEYLKQVKLTAHKEKQYNENKSCP